MVVKGLPAVISTCYKLQLDSETTDSSTESCLLADEQHPKTHGLADVTPSTFILGCDLRLPALART